MLNSVVRSIGVAGEVVNVVSTQGNNLASRNSNAISR